MLISRGAHPFEVAPFGFVFGVLRGSCPPEKKTTKNVVQRPTVLRFSKWCLQLHHGIMANDSLIFSWKTPPPFLLQQFWLCRTNMIWDLGGSSITCLKTIISWHYLANWKKTKWTTILSFSNGFFSHSKSRVLKMYQHKDLFHCLLSQAPCKQTMIHTSFRLQHAFDLCKIELEIEVVGMFSTHHNHQPI